MKPVKPTCMVHTIPPLCSFKDEFFTSLPPIKLKCYNSNWQWTFTAKSPQSSTDRTMRSPKPDLTNALMVAENLLQVIKDCQGPHPLPLSQVKGGIVWVSQLGRLFPLRLWVWPPSNHAKSLTLMTASCSAHALLVPAFHKNQGQQQRPSISTSIVIHAYLIHISFWGQHQMLLSAC